MKTEPYRPSNGTDGEGFMGAWCERCARDVGHNCSILARALAFDLEDPEYPKEWVRLTVRPWTPSCTAFVPMEELSNRAKRAWQTRRDNLRAAHAGDLFPEAR